MPLELFKRDPALWKTQNPEWLKNREHEWKEIVRRLSAVPHWISKKQLIDNQQYFIYGDTEFKCNVHIGKDRYPDNTWRLKEIILQIWYYPGEITAEDIQPCSDYRAKIITQRDDWYKAIAEIRQSISRDDTGYGLMGGRERIVTERFY